MIDDKNILLMVQFTGLLMLSAFFAATETALMSVNRIKIKHKADNGSRKAIALENLLSQPTRYLATILLLNNLVNVAAAAIATILVARIFQHWVATISTGVVTFLILVFGEITPKTLAIQNAERFSLLIARPISFLSTILYPIARFFVAIANVVTRIFGVKAMKEGPFITEEEIKTLVSVGEEEGVIEEDEKRLIDSIFEFSDTVVKEVMIPRMDMICVEDCDEIKAVLKIVREVGHSRIPVFHETVDNVIGIVYTKDILINIAEGKPDILLKDLTRDAYYIPESKNIGELLRELQQKRQHMAIVVDEYGGTAGLITMEDILEEIVGEIFDEYDLKEELIEKIDSSTYRVDARVNIEEINKVMGIALPEKEVETIGGFVYNLVGKIPNRGEKVDFENLVFKVESIARRRISKIIVTKKGVPQSEDE